MPKPKNRVLSRLGARLLTLEESERVGGVGTATGCTLTGVTRNGATDIVCEDCPEC